MTILPFQDPAALAMPRVRVEARGPAAGWVLRHPEPLQPYTRCIGDWLEHWARTTPDAVYLGERDTSGAWTRLTYAQVRERVGRLAQGLLDLEMPPGAPVTVLSDNSVEHALLALATLHIGRPLAVVSSAYCRLTRDYTKVHAMLDALRPGLLYASDAAVYAPAASTWAGSAPRAYGRGAAQVSGVLELAALAEARETPAVMRAFEAIRPDDPAKYLLTSGSTGLPKVVINSHRMLTANQQQIAQVWPFLLRHRLELLDWLPWSHTFGANHNFHMVLAHGGTLYVDEGRPAPGLIERTVHNLRDIRPNFYFNVPRGFDMLLPFLEQDDALARDVLERMEGVFYAGAALPQSLWRRLEDVVARTRGRPLWFTSAWGATETSPALTTVHWSIDRAGCIGLPLPGVELKLVPNGDKLEMRVRGPNVFPGYRDAPQLTAQAFDAEGYYLIGDAGKWVDPERPEAGVAFDGRVAEDFKLQSGSWVSVGTLRLRAVTALSPLAADVVVTGHDREEVGLLVFPSAATRTLAPDALAQQLRQALLALRAEGGGTSQTPTRIRMLTEPPNADAGEITDKGYVNQAAVLRRCAADVIALYSNVPDDATIRL